MVPEVRLKGNRQSRVRAWRRMGAAAQKQWGAVGAGALGRDADEVPGQAFHRGSLVSSGKLPIVRDTTCSHLTQTNHQPAVSADSPSWLVAY